MSFGSPTSDLERGEYAAGFTHTNGQSIVIRSAFGDPSPNTLDPTDMDEAFADAVALLDGSADFTFTFGQKSYTTAEGYTP